MKKRLINIFLLLILSLSIFSVNYGPHTQWANIDFEDDTSADVLGNAASTLMNGANVVPDAERGGKVLQFSATTKGCLRLDTSPISDTLSISFWGKREDTDPSGCWRMFLALYANDGSNIYLTPLTSWNSNSYLIVENKAYSSYKSLSGKTIENNKWYHFTVVFADNFVRYYLNGVLQVEMQSLYKLSDFRMTKYYFGCNPEMNYPMTGRIDDLKIFHSALYDNQIQAIYEGKPIPEPAENTTTPVSMINLTANVSAVHQTIQNFGASDGWNAQTAGLYFPESKKEKMAEILFSKDTFPDGTPKGIALSGWRFNIGAGTSEQGTASRIATYDRRTECFLNADKTTYDWTKQAGQRWFLEKAAKVYGVEDIIGWQNSPPVYFTVRGLGFREYGDAKNSILKTEEYGNFGNFLATVFNHFKEEGIHFKYLSPLNEPQWEWNAASAGGTVNQEGSPWMNQEVSNVVKAINNSFVQKGVTVKQFITEAGSINYLLNNGTGYYAKQLYTFWDPASPLTVANLPSLSTHVSSHSYWTDASAVDIVNQRRTLREQIKALNPNLDYWQTEYCLLGTGYKFGHKDGDTRTLSSMECGISMARIIHNDLVEADCTGWQWWTTFEFDSKGGTEDRYALFRFELNAAKNDGVYRTSKLLYTLGNYSRFVRPGMKRIDTSRSDNMNAVDAVTKQMFSAYTDGNEVVIVAVNASTDAVSLKLNANGLAAAAQVKSWTPYVTTGNPYDNLKRYPSVASGAEYVLPGTSVVTFVGKITSGQTPIDKTQLSVSRLYPNPSREQVTVSSDHMIRKVLISDISGKTMTFYSCNDSEYTIPVNTMPVGIYFVTIETDKGTDIQKLQVR